MKISGIKLMGAIRKIKEESNLTATQISSSFFITEGAEPQERPEDLIARYEALERQLARLQEAQHTLNLKVKVTIGDETMSLQNAIKLHGVQSRIKAYWQVGAAPLPSAHLKYMGIEEPIVQTRALPKDECLSRMRDADDKHDAFTEAIRYGNNRDVEINLDPQDLER